MNQTSVPHQSVARCLRFMARHWHRPINVTDLIRVSGMSRRGFLKAYLRHLGGPPGRALRRLRMERAKQLIRSTTLPLNAVAARCGYSRFNSFWVSFRNYTGASPRAYRDTFASVRSLPRPRARVGHSSASPPARNGTHNFHGALQKLVEQRSRPAGRLNPQPTMSLTSRQTSVRRTALSPRSGRRRSR